MLNTPAFNTYGDSNVNIDLLEQINNIYKKAQEEALSRYNAADFKAPVIETHALDLNTNYQFPVITPSKPRKSTRTKYDGSSSDFVNEIFNSYYNAVRPRAASDADAIRQAKLLAQKAAFETNRGKSVVNTHNYGGHRINGKWLSFDSMDDFTKKDVALLDRKWGNWRNAKSESDFVNAITTNNGKGSYAPKSEYKNYIGLSNEINNYLNMRRRKLRCGGKVSRPKAMLGGAGGGGLEMFTALSDTMLGAFKAANDAAEENYRRKYQVYQDRYANGVKEAAAMTNALQQSKDYQEAYLSQFRMPYKNGGRRKLRNAGFLQSSLRGGSDIILESDNAALVPIGNNVYSVYGPTHSQGGINMTLGGSPVNVEGGGKSMNKPGEVIEVNNDDGEIRIYSKHLKDKNGLSFADEARIGAKFGGDLDYTFAKQQRKNNNRSLGKKKASLGLAISRPVEEIYEGGRNPNTNTLTVNPVSTNNTVVNTSLSRDKFVEDPYKVDYQNKKKPLLIDESAAAMEGLGAAGGWFGSLMGGFGMALKGSNFKNGGRIKAEDGIIVRNGRKYKRVKYPNSNNTYLQDVGPANGSVNTNNKTLNTNNRKTNRQYNYNPGAALPTTRGIAFNNNSLSSFDPEGQVGRYWERNGTSNVEEQSAYIKPKAADNVRSLVNTGNKNKRNRGVSINTGRRRLADRGVSPVSNDIDEFKPYYPDDELLKEAYDGTLLWEGPDESTSISSINNDVVNKPVPVEERVVKPVYEKDKRKTDWYNLIGLGLQGAGSLIGGLIADKTLSDIKSPAAPVGYNSVKLPTTYNITPQLANNQLLRSRLMRDSNESSSSVARLQRRNYANTYINSLNNALWGQKFNEENKMLTADALNRQSQVNASIKDYNQWLRDKSNLELQRSILRGQNRDRMISGLIGAFNDYDAQRRQNLSDNLTMNWYLSTLKDADRDYFLRNKNRNLVAI